MFPFFKPPPPPPPPPLPWWGEPVTPLLPNLSVLEASLFVIFMSFLMFVRIYGETHEMKKKADLHMGALNRVNVFKECFLGYVNAGMLEPIIAIASDDVLSARALVINMCQLIGLFSWLYLLSDAFDITDTQQGFIYWDRVCEQGTKTSKDLPEWLIVKKAESKGYRTDDAVALRGSILRDVALWFMLACSMSAFFGVTTHRDVIHSHAVVILWALLHHQSRLATAWRGTGYFHTFFSPSAALLPLEYCFNLTDQEMIGDEDGVGDLDKWRQYIISESGVELIIHA
ncbi:hypothetical protein AB1Y20_018200 [Prymnesium parvum]|uniref:Glycerophosphocholine acyltransferase 1 n=1 Tax=Prymnesium parvum TaxID=97485 RepID=A0AB34JP98_PRYPA